MIANYGQGIVLNMFFGTIVNAAQGVAGQVSGQLGAFAGTMLKALNPVIAKSEGAGNRALMLKASMIGTKISFFLLFIFYIPVLIEMPYIFKLWLKNVPEYTVIFCRLLLIRNLIEQLYITLGASISAVGNIQTYQIYGSILNISPLILTYFLFLLHFPPFTLYIVFMIYSLASAWLVFYFAKINCKLSIPIFLKTVVAPSVLSFLLISVLSLIPLFVLPEGLTRLVTVTGVSLVAFLLTTWFVGLTVEERVSIGQMAITYKKHKSMNKKNTKIKSKSYSNDTTRTYK
jgi:O-antigen/teichoic acid export membrane protein